MGTVCPLCGGETSELFVGKVLRKYAAEYRYCQSCDYVFVREPHWLDEAYSDAIVEADTDVATRNMLLALKLSAFLYFAGGERGAGRYVDVAGGYGLLTRLMRDLGFDFYWSDLYAKNLFARGFEYDSSSGRCQMITAIEVIEHTVNPLSFLAEQMALHQCDSVMFTTEVFADGAPPAPGAWSYYSFDTGQHISFFSERGLRLLAQRLGLCYCRYGRVHLFSRRTPPRFRAALSSNKFLVPALSMFAAWRLGSKRGADQTLLIKRKRGGHE